MIAIDLSKQQALYSDPKAIQQISFTGSLERDDGVIMFFITEEAKKQQQQQQQQQKKKKKWYWSNFGNFFKYSWWF